MPGGIWNEDELPVLGWEAAEYRVVVPEDLQRAIGIERPVLRWSLKKYMAVTQKHSHDVHIVLDMSRYLSRWEYAGEDAGAHASNTRILLRDETGRWYAISIGHDASGSLNVITVAGRSTKGFMPNRLRRLRNVIRKEK